MILYLSKGRSIHFEKSKGKLNLITTQKVIIKAGRHQNRIPLEPDVSPVLLNGFSND